LLVVSFLSNPNGRIVYLLYAPLFLVLYSWIGTTMSWYFPSFITFSIILLFYGCTYSIEKVLELTDRFTNGWIARLGTREVLWAAVFLIFVTANNYKIDPGRSSGSKIGFLLAPDPSGKHWEKWENERFHAYRGAAEYLNAQEENPGLALISEVGYR
jgi:hypothetical protein